MIHLKYECKVYFVKLPLIWTDLCLKLVFENATAVRKTGCRSVVNCAITHSTYPLFPKRRDKETGLGGRVSWQN